MQELDLSKAFGGNPLAFDCIVYFNGLAVRLKALVDTGANGDAFMNRRRAERLRQTF